ncbi:MAG: sugar phosphate isomerase/epimerase family protein, partial [Limisphaerales bacterium]
VNDISAQQRKEIRELAAKIGIEISGIHWVLAQTKELHLTHPDAPVREKTAKYFCDLVDFCGDIGGKIIVAGSPKQRNVLENVSREDAWNFATEIFREPVMRAENREVKICLEPLAPSETNFINTAEEAIRFTQQLNTPHFKIILDVKAMGSEAKPVAQVIREPWPHFAYFHANDKNLKGPGFGEIDFKPIAAALKEVGYKSFVSVEVFKFDEGAEIIATQSLAYLKKSFGNGIE